MKKLLCLIVPMLAMMAPAAAFESRCYCPGAFDFREHIETEMKYYGPLTRIHMDQPIYESELRYEPAGVKHAYYSGYFNALEQIKQMERLHYLRQSR